MKQPNCRNGGHHVRFRIDRTPIDTIVDMLKEDNNGKNVKVQRDWYSIYSSTMVILWIQIQLCCCLGLIARYKGAQEKGASKFFLFRLKS